MSTSLSSDEALARSLQELEFRGRGSDQEDDFAKRVEDAIWKARKCEDEVLQAIAVSLVPLSEMEETAEETVKLNESLGSTGSCSKYDLIAQKLLLWFKNDFFTWQISKSKKIDGLQYCPSCSQMDAPNCTDCGRLTANQGVTAPLPEEQAYNASRIELYYCNACTVHTRFPRYNDVNKLLETRRGRCGEWANTFLLFLRAAGFTARYVLDWTDHVWTEYFSPQQQHWVHLDCCEAAWNKPLLYEAGWGKQLSYVVAVGIHGAQDVTRRYTRNWDQVLARRTLVPEAWLSAYLGMVTADLRKGLDRPTLLQLEGRDQAADKDTAASPDDLDMPGRQSGSIAWRRARGETQETLAAEASARPGQLGIETATLYARVRGDHLPDMFKWSGRLGDGACRASGENGVQEAAVNAFDGNADSKWLDFGGGGQQGTCWLEFRLMGGADAVVLSHYDIVSANDFPERDPCDWVVEAFDVGSNAGWRNIDTRKGVRFRHRFQLCTFRVRIAVTSTRFRLRILHSFQPDLATCIQLSCWNLYSRPAAVPVEDDGKVMQSLRQVLSKGHSDLHQDAKSGVLRIHASNLPSLLRNQESTTSLFEAGLRPLLLHCNVHKCTEPFFIADTSDELEAEKHAKALSDGAAQDEGVKDG